MSIKPEKKKRRKPIKWPCEREMGCEEAGDPLPDGRIQESAGSSAACGRGPLALPAARWGTTDD